MGVTKVYVLVRGRNALPYVLRCLESILRQTYPHLTVLFVDDASDYTKETQKKITSLLKGHICVWRKQRFNSIRNAYEMINSYCEDPEGIVVNVDADDWLAEDTAIEKIVRSYQKQKCLISYGNCFIWKGEDLEHLPVASQSMLACNVPYSNETVQKRDYRQQPFLVYHPRSWKVKAYKAVPKEAFLRSDGSWLDFCEDQAIFMPLLEMFGHRCYCCREPLSVYNQANISADVKVNRLPLLRDEIEIRRKPSYEPQDI